MIGMAWSYRPGPKTAGDPQMSKKYFTRPYLLQFFTRPYLLQSVKVLKAHTFHRCRIRHIFGGAKDFTKISRNSPEKNCKKITAKKWLHFIPFRAHFFQIKALQAPFLPKFPPNLPKFPLTCPRKNWRNMTSKKKRNICTFISGAIFVKTIKRFCEGFHTFCPNLHRFFLGFKGFSRIFIKSKFLGVGFHLVHPHLYLNLLLKTFTQLVWMSEKAVLPQTHLIRFAWNVKIQRSPHTLDEGYPSNLWSYSSLW